VRECVRPCGLASICARHNGGLHQIQLYLQRVQPDCLINSDGVLDSRTLRDIGVEGIIPGECDEHGDPLARPSPELSFLPLDFKQFVPDPVAETT